MGFDLPLKLDLCTIDEFLDNIFSLKLDFFAVQITLFEVWENTDLVAAHIHLVVYYIE